jgi:large subunit ribosomal protein L18e
MLSRSKIKTRSRKKNSPELQKTIALSLKNPAWQPVSAILSGPTRSFSAVSLSEIDSNTEIGDTVLIPGKVLSSGEISKKVRIVALSFSEKAEKKAKSAKAETVSILEEIKKNSKFEGIKILR